MARTRYVVDPLGGAAMMASLAPADTARVARALEVVRSTGATLESWQARTAGGIGERVRIAAAILLPERETLYARCDKRLEQMFGSGAIEEVARLLARELDPRLPVMRAIGVAEIAAFLRSEISLQEAQAQAAQATRNYAKRQFTWLRHQPPSDWPRIEIQSFADKAAYASLFHVFGLTRHFSSPRDP